MLVSVAEGPGGCILIGIAVYCFELSAIGYELVVRCEGRAVLISAEEISEDSIVCWSSAPVVTEVNREVILMNLDRDRCYGLGNTGSDIWRRLSSPIRVSELARQLREAYDSAPGELEADLLRTLKEFAVEGLIRVGAPTS